jgi:predicted nucleotidyltransferase
MDAKAVARKALLEQELDRYVSVLKQTENPDKVIVFGSLATGNVHEWSDIDLVIVTQTNLSFLQRMRAIRKIIQPQVAVEILCYTPDEFARLCKERLFFREEILGKGKLLYERPS